MVSRAAVGAAGGTGVEAVAPRARAADWAWDIDGAGRAAAESLE